MNVILFFYFLQGCPAGTEAIWLFLWYVDITTRINIVSICYWILLNGRQHVSDTECFDSRHGIVTTGNMQYILTQFVNSDIEFQKNGSHFADNSLEWIFLFQKWCIVIRISLHFVPNDLINNSVANRHGDHFGFGLSQWETALYWNVVFHWLSPYQEWSLSHTYIYFDGVGCYDLHGLMKSTSWYQRDVWTTKVLCVTKGYTIKRNRTGIDFKIRISNYIHMKLWVILTYSCLTLWWIKDSVWVGEVNCLCMRSWEGYFGVYFQFAKQRGK